MPRRRLFGNTLILLHNEYQISFVHKFTYTFIMHQCSVTCRFEVSLFRGKTYEVSILKKRVYSILKSLGVAVLDAIVYSDRDFTSWFAVNTIQYRLFFSPEYCKNVGNGNFIISIPFWRLQYEVEKEKIPEVYITSANYEVVVFGFSTIEQPGGEISLTSSFQCIVIDDGIINFNKNRFPLPLQSTEPKGAGGKIII
jgi:hypothetical protein